MGHLVQPRGREDEKLALWRLRRHGPRKFVQSLRSVRVRCLLCGVARSEFSFDACAESPDGLRPWCTVCRGGRRAEKRLPASLTCDCGKAKAPAAEACASCLGADLQGAAGALVSALRSLGGGPATIEALADAAGLETASVYRVFRGMRPGRIVARVEDDGYLFYYLIGV